MHMDTLGPTIFLGNTGLKLMPDGEGPWSGVWDGGIGSIRLYHDEDGEHIKKLIPVQEHGINIFEAKVHDVVDAIKEGKTAAIPGEEILINQAIINGIIRSSVLGKEVDIHIPEF